MIELGRIHMEDCNSPGKAFYQLYLYEDEKGGYLIEKRSGAKGRSLTAGSGRGPPGRRPK